MLNLHFWKTTPMMQSPAKRTEKQKPSTLAQVHTGVAAKITGFGKLSLAHRQHLQAYGLIPGRSVIVLAQRPVTIVLVEQTELAFEKEIARQVTVEEEAA